MGEDQLREPHAVPEYDNEVVRKEVQIICVTFVTNTRILQ
jgi:hypothetical protein